MSQMSGAVFSLVLLAMKGLNETSLGAAAVTT
jgi:hypothetical protein